MRVTTPLSDELGAYLDVASQQLKLTAANMANVDTPGYRTLGINFQSAFASALQGGTGDSQVGEVDGLLARPDGNNVSMDREALQLAKVQLQFKTGVELLKHQYSLVMDAIHADGK